jgi:hypothetical protein
MLIRPWSFAQRDLASIRMLQGTPELWTPWWSSCCFPLALLQLLLQEVSGRRVDAWTLRHTKAFIVPWRACLWFRRNFGSVPLSDGYLEVFGFLILHSTQKISTIRKNTEFWDFRTRCGGPFCCSKVSRVDRNRPWEKYLPLVMLRGVLRFRHLGGPTMKVWGWRMDVFGGWRMLRVCAKST